MNDGDGKKLYRCKECGFHYFNKEIAEKCEAWCGENHSCNLDIIKNAIESGKKEK